MGAASMGALEYVGYAVAGAPIGGAALWGLVTWINRQKLIQAGDNSHEKLIKSLTEERDQQKAWREESDGKLKDATELLHEVQTQNQLLKILIKTLLMQRGIEVEELQRLADELGVKL